MNSHRGRTTLGTIACVFIFAAIQSFPAHARQPPSKRPATRSFDGFTIKLSLSPKAKETLIQRKETIVIFGYFYGGPKEDTSRKYVDDMGEVWLGNLPQTEVHPGDDASFKKFELDSKALERIDGGPLLLINVVSGRKSSKDNLLDCDFYEGPYSKVEGGSIPISCKLIAE